MNKIIPILVILGLGLAAQAYERLQGPTELTFWDRAQTYDGYTLFGAQGTSYLIDMEGRLVHTWPVGVNPRLLDTGDLLDAMSGDINGFAGLREVDWAGSNVWSYTESRTGYHPHHDFMRIHNRKLGANTTLYIANKEITSNQCIAAGCNPGDAPYTNVTVDCIVEVDGAGTVVWEWCFFDHGIQDANPAQSNYAGAGKSITNYPGRINLNLPGRPLTNDWLHCVSLDYNTNLDQIAITAEGGEFYVIDHGSTFISNNPSASVALAASTNGDFLYRFGDPARYGQGSAPSITLNWTVWTTGNKQVGGMSQATWIPAGVPGAGHFLVFNNGQDLFEATPQSYLFEVNGYLNSSTNDTGAYVNPPAAGYTIWSAPGHDTDKQKKNLSRQVVATFMAMANQGFFSHIGGSAQRLPNSNMLVCATAEGHLFEVTSSGEAVWEYINPVTTNGVATYKRDTWPLYNPVWRATRYSASHPALTNRTLAGTSTIAGQAPSYISAPAISGVSQTPEAPDATNAVAISALVTNNRVVAAAVLTYIVNTSTSAVAMASTGALYGATIPVAAAGTVVRYFVSAADDFGNSATSSVGSYTVQSGATNPPPSITGVTCWPGVPTDLDSVLIRAVVTDAVALSSVVLAYTTGVGTGATNPVFAETMATNMVSPWTGGGTSNQWTVVSLAGAANVQQTTNANHTSVGAGGLCGAQFTKGSANASDTMITTSNAINAAGSGGYVEFWIYASNLTNGLGWTFQLAGNGSNFTTRLSELTGTNHSWRLFHYDLLPDECVGTLKMRFQFVGNGVGGPTGPRVNIDDITLRSVTAGAVYTNLAMTLAGGSLYAAQVPAQAAGATVSYYLTALDNAGVSTVTGVGSYLVLSAVDSVGDGIPDWWRARYFGGAGSTTDGLSCATCDRFGSGQDNLAKYLADLDPTNPAARFAIVGMAFGSDGIQLQWVGGSNAWQFLECAPAPDAAAWTVLYTNPPPTAATNSFPHSVIVPSNLFYRLRAGRSL